MEHRFTLRDVLREAFAQIDARRARTKAAVYAELARREAKDIMGRETRVVDSCLDYLVRHLGWSVWRNNTGTIRMPGYEDKNGTVRPDRFVAFGAKGSPDIIGFGPGGVFIGVECKAPKDDIYQKKAGKQSAAQKAFQARCVEDGAVYIVAHSAAELHDALRPHMSRFSKSARSSPFVQAQTH